jgi:hypothetical protein
VVIDQPKYKVLDSRCDRVAKTEFWNNTIIFIKLDENAHIELEDSISQHQFLKSKYDGINKHLVLVEAGEYTSISKEAREFSILPESNDMTKATAVIVKSLAHRLIINFIINFTGQQYMKMRIFEDKQKAIDWLLSLK